MLIDYPLFAAPLSHIFLTIYNVSVFIAGILFLIIGCFVNSQRYLLYDLYVDSFALSLMILIMVGITAGVLLIDVSFYRGSLVEGSCQILGLSVLMLLICTFELSAFLSGTLLRNQLENRTKSDLYSQLKLYNFSNTSTTNWMDYIQNEIGCCGVTSSEDWRTQFHIDYYPKSCCKKEYLSIKDCGMNKTLIYTRSCMDVFLLWMRNDVTKFSIGCFVLCVAQILGVIGICLADDKVESRWNRMSLKKEETSQK